MDNQTNNRIREEFERKVKKGYFSNNGLGVNWDKVINFILSKIKKLEASDSKIEIKGGFVTGELEFVKDTNIPIYKARINGELERVILLEDYQKR